MNVRSLVLPFVKYSACGNDFLIVEGADARSDLASLSRQLCDRHLGVGADGVEWLFPHTSADTHARLFNGDGSEAEISGNGTRCVAAYICERNLKETIVIRTGAGLKTCTLTSRNDRQYEFETDMGEPEIGRELAIRAASGVMRGTEVSMGNPHFVAIVSEFAPAWQAHAQEVAANSSFPNGVNIELVRVQDERSIEVRFFERGVGETQSSGTGSCAAAVAAISAALVSSPLRVSGPGGTQTVRWEKRVFLRGSAQLICRGEFFL